MLRSAWFLLYAQVVISRQGPQLKHALDPHPQVAHIHSDRRRVHVYCLRDGSGTNERG